MRLTQILLNILSNGIKFNRTGGTISLRIRQLKSAPTGYGNYQFIIRDTGIGMKPEFQEHIFESFTREETSTVSGIRNRPWNGDHQEYCRYDGRYHHSKK